jgi:hypothetical protein
MLSLISRDERASVLVAGLAEVKGLQSMFVVGAFIDYLFVCKFSFRQ